MARSTPEPALDLVPGEDGTRLRLRVKPGARRDGVVGILGGALKVQVRAAPERGRANEAVLDLLATLLDLPTGGIELVAGQGSQDKVVRIALPPDETRRRLSPYVR